MLDFTGTWKMRRSENFDELLKALGVNAMLRKVAAGQAYNPPKCTLYPGVNAMLRKVAAGQAYNPPKCTLYPGVNAMLRRVAAAAASKPHVQIRHSGEQFYIKTSTSVRTTEISFHIGQEFDEETVDGRKCKSLATWETENKIYCKQTLLEGHGPQTYWTRELKGDELILTLGADNVVCTRIYIRE